MLKMRHIRLLLTLQIVTLCAFVKAQTLSVESFRLLENDLAANTQGTMMRDQNGDVAALIRVVTSEKGFVFDGGMMGIVGTKQDVGEILLYVPHGIQKITIKHDQLGVLRDWYFPIPIEKARTYEMKLLTGRVRTVIEDEVSAQFVVLHVEPANSTVTIDGKAALPDKDGNVSQLLSYGQHEYRVESPGYKTEAGTVQVGSEKVNLNVTLQSSKATITLQCPMAEADIYVNEEFVGQGTWTGQLAAAMYMIEVRREGYQTRSSAITVDEFEERTITLPEPYPLYGHVQIQSTPIGATVFLDGEEIGQTPHLQRDVQVGNHTVVVKSDGYLDFETTVLIENSKVAQLNVSLVGQNQVNRRREVNETAVQDDSRTARRQPDQDRIKELKENAPAPKSHNVKKTCLYLGGFCAPGELFSYGGQVGLYVSNVNLEAAFGVHDRDIEGYWVSNSSASQQKADSYKYIWQFDHTASVRLGYGIGLTRTVRVTPQLGVAITQLKSQEDELFRSQSDYKDKKTFIAGGQAAVKLEWIPARHLSLFVAPGYTIPVSKGKIAELLDENDKSVSKYAGGLKVSLGVNLVF